MALTRTAAKSLDFEFEVKAGDLDTKTRSFSGYASVFGVIDQGRDVVLRGAFAESLEKRLATDNMPGMFWAHRTDKPIGKWTKMQEDDYGLYAEGSLTEGVQQADEAYRLLKDRAIKGMSIGFRVMPNGAEYDGDLDIRKLKLLDLIETSLVANPMLTQAQVTEVKNINLDVFNPRELERSLKEIPGMTGGLAVKAISTIKAHLKRDVNGDDSNSPRDGDELAQLLEAVKAARMAIT